MINAITNSTPTTNSENSDEIPTQPVMTNTSYEEPKPQSQTTTPPVTDPHQMSSNGDTIKPKKKMQLRTLIGVVVLVLILLGSGAGFYLTQYTNLDTRQQAWYGETCAKDADCDGYPHQICQGGYCVPKNTDPSCGSSFTPWGLCDPDQSTTVNECEGAHYSASSCQLGYREWICGNKQWIPDHGNPKNEECVGQCPWNVPAGQPCCPVGGDACDPNIDEYKCISDPYVSRCQQWGDGSCPGGGGVWTAFVWCIEEGCECELFKDYSGPGCSCGGGGPKCNDQCFTNDECQETNANFICATIDGSKRCRLSSDPTSESCEEEQTTYSCNSDCQTTAQCQGDLGANYSCVTNKCRLTSNPTSDTCQPGLQGKTFNVSTKFICPDGSTPSAVERRFAWRILPPTTAIWSYNPKTDFNGVTTNISQTITIPDINAVANQSIYVALVEGSLLNTWWGNGNDDLEPYKPIQDPAYPAIEAGDFFEEPMFKIDVANSTVPTDFALSFEAPEELCTPDAPMCKDVAILDSNNNELKPQIQPSPFYIGQIVKFRCAADDPNSSLISKYEFRITEPDGKIIEGDKINPGGKSAISQDYQIGKNGTFKAQCRLCLTTGCQNYLDITTK